MTDGEQAIVDAINALPERIVALMVATFERVEDEEPAPVGCSHPMDARVDLGGGDWECGVRECRHTFSAHPQGAPV